MAIEKFIAQSSKSAKYAKTVVKKRDVSTSNEPARKLDGANATIAAGLGQPKSASSGKEIAASNSGKNLANSQTNE